MDIDKAQEILDRVAESLPKEFFNELNGGILLLSESKKSPYAQNDDLWIMGEYIRSGTMGRMIKIYFGSFEMMYSYLPDDEVAEKLRATLLHEFTHHLESLGGERGMEIEDEINLREYLKAHGK